MHKARVRVIPCLLLKDESLVKTIKFKEYNYIGDPINTVRIFNGLEVDELCFLDITATQEKRPPNFKLLENIANECFMPLSYGGGLNNIEDIKRIFSIGFEKVVINSECFNSIKLITEVAEIYGSQAVVASVDYKRNFLGQVQVYSNSGTVKRNVDLKKWLIQLQSSGAGEILLTSIDNEGTWSGYDVKTISEVAKELSIPLIANGGAGQLSHLRDAVISAGASAVALGSMVVYQKKDMGVLVNFPGKKELAKIFTRN